MTPDVSRETGTRLRPERVAGLPPIEGFPTVPVRPYSQCSPRDWSDAHYRLWTIHLDDVHASAGRAPSWRPRAAPPGLRLEGGHPLRGSHVEGVGSLITLERGDHRVSSSIAVTGDLEGGT
jgi:hypothetical protein